MDDQHISYFHHLCGSDDHLTFALRQNSIPIDDGGPTSLAQTNYFTLGEALGVMLQQQMLLGVDPDVAAAAGFACFEEVTLTGRYSGISYAQYIFCPPESEVDRPPDGPGIYLDTRQGSDWLRKATGLPFPNEDDLIDSNMILLARYGAGSKLEFTATYTALQMAVDQQQQDHRLTRNQHDFITVFKGGDDATSSNTGRVSPESFRQFYHFSNAYEAIRNLLICSVDHFNRQCAPAGFVNEIEYAFVQDTNGLLLAAINNWKIGSDQSWDTTAGLWLQGIHNMETLSERTAINFMKIVESFPDDHVFCLAEYKYNSGLSLEQPDKVKELVAQLQSGDDLFLDYPRSPFLLKCEYELLPESPEIATTINVLHGYHHMDCKAAIHQLVCLELPLLLPLFKHAPMSLATAKICDEESGSLASLDVLMSYAGVPSGASLVIHPELGKADPQLYDELMSLARAQSQTHSQRQPAIIVIANYDATTVTWTRASGFELLEPIIQPYVSRQPFMQQAATQEVLTSAESPANYIRLEWNRPPKDNETLTQTISLSQDLHAAHRFLLQIDEKLFVPEPGNDQRPHLLSASLCDRATEAVLVKRFYKAAASNEQAATPKEHPLFQNSFLSYHPDLPQAKELAESLGVGVADAMSPPATHTAMTHPPPGNCQRRQKPGAAPTDSSIRPRH